MSRVIRWFGVSLALICALALPAGAAPIDDLGLRSELSAIDDSDDGKIVSEGLALNFFSEASSRR